MALYLADITKDAIVTILKITAPVTVGALGIGLLISFFQAITQMQDTAISFVPKIQIVYFLVILFSPYIGSELYEFALRSYEMAANID